MKVKLIRTMAARLCVIPSFAMLVLSKPSDSPRMFHPALIITCLLGFAALCATGCVMRRTVKEGNEVVAQGYVVKSPLNAP